MATVSESRRCRERSVVLPYWLDRPAEEALAIADAAAAAGFTRLWIGEMATFDAFALATAIGLRAPRLRLSIGPLAIGGLHDASGNWQIPMIGVAAAVVVLGVSGVLSSRRVP